MEHNIELASRSLTRALVDLTVVSGMIGAIKNDLNYELNGRTTYLQGLNDAASYWGSDGFASELPLNQFIERLHAAWLSK